MLDIANRAWLAPALYAALERNELLTGIPHPVRDYLAFIHGRNLERNRRLRAQLIEATVALNARNIEPILLKGAVSLFTADAKSLGARMLSDLDISIRPFEMFETKAALVSLGYRDLGSGREFGRDQDVGVVELHDRPNARSMKYLSQDLRASSRKVTQDRALVRIPSPTAQAVHLIVHDMIKDGDYWSLRIDLRHLRDLAELASSPEGIDWERLREVMSDKTSRNALLVQLKALEDLFGVGIPIDLRAGLIGRLRHIGRLTAANPGRTGSAARLIGNASRGLNRLRDGHAWNVGWNIPKKIYRRLSAPGKGSRL